MIFLNPAELKPQWEWLTRTVYDPSITWVAITAVATLVLVYLAAVPLRRLVKAKKTELAWRLRNDFLTPRVRDILYLIDHGMLEYQPDGPCFSFAGIDEVARLRVRESFGDTVLISAFEIDDDILNPLDEISALAFEGSLQMEDVYAIFGNFIGSTVQNGAILAHIRAVRTRPNASEAWLHMERIVPGLERLDARFRRRSVVRRDRS